MSRFVWALVASLAIAASAAAQAGTWQIDPNHSSAQFAVKHLAVSTVRGAFTKVSGSATYDPADPSKTSLEATIDANSVDTRVEMRDNDLRSARFFDVQKYPTITFHSKQVKVVSAGKLQIAGDLTIHGVTKERCTRRRWAFCADQRSDGQGTTHWRVGNDQDQPTGFWHHYDARWNRRRDHHHHRYGTDASEVTQPKTSGRNDELRPVVVRPALEYLPEQPEQRTRQKHGHRERKHPCEREVPDRA